MATSGGAGLSCTLNDLIAEAYELAGAKDLALQGVDSAIASSARRSLNMMVKAWQADGAFIWKHARAWLFLEAGKSRYDLGTTARAVKNALATTLHVRGIAGAVTITPLVLTGIAAGQTVGIGMDAGIIHWTTVAGVGAAAVALATPLPAAASVGSPVYAYSPASLLKRPYDVTDVRTLPWPWPAQGSGYAYAMRRLNRDEYSHASRFLASGAVPMGWYFEPGRAGGNALHLAWIPAEERAPLELDAREVVEDFKAGDDEADFPQEWFMALAYGLAVHVAEKRGAVDRIERLQAQADFYRAAASGRDRETHFTFKVP